MIDPDEKFVYLGRGGRGWWTGGIPRPIEGPVRDMLWPVSLDHRLCVGMITLDLRTLKIYMKIDYLHERTERDFRSSSLRRSEPNR